MNSVELYEQVEKMLEKSFQVYEDISFKCEEYIKLAAFGKMIFKNNVSEEMVKYWKRRLNEWTSYMMEKFEELYGCNPSDIDAKRKLEYFEGMTDEEIEEYIEYSNMEMSEMLSLKWKKFEFI